MLRKEYVGGCRSGNRHRYSLPDGSRMVCCIKCGKKRKLTKVEIGEVKDG